MVVFYKPLRGVFQGLIIRFYNIFIIRLYDIFGEGLYDFRCKSI